jgi:hypothetical protein
MQQQLSATAGCTAVDGADSIGFRRCIFHRSSRYSCNSASEQHAIVDSSVTLLLPVCFTSRVVKYYYAIKTIAKRFFAKLNIYFISVIK